MASLWISPPLVSLPAPVAAGSRPAVRQHPRAAAGSCRPQLHDRSLPWHFYRRRALAAAGFGLVLLLAWHLVGLAGGALVEDPATQWGAAPDVAVVVHDAEPGETLWDLAVALGPAGDVRASLDELIRLNGGSTLIVGEPVKVPRSWYEGVPR